MNSPFALSLFLADGCPDGIKIIEKSNWNGCGLVCPRILFPRHRFRPEFKKPGVYFLVGHGDLEEKLYIGEGDSLLSRLDQHYRTKDWWYELVAFSSKDQNLNKAFVQFLEANLIRLAKETGRFSLENIYFPEEPSLSEMDRAICQGFLKEILLCLPILGINICHHQSPSNSEKKMNKLAIQAKGIRAEGYEVTDGFIVLKGSLAVFYETLSIPKGIWRLRNKLMETGVLKQGRDKVFYFTQDYLFDSPSTASSVILGCSCNGRDIWKNETGLSLKHLQLQQLN